MIQLKVREAVGGFKIAGDLRSENQINIKRLNGYWMLQRNTTSNWTSMPRGTEN